MTPASEIGRTPFLLNTGANIKPGINHFCLTVENSKVDLTILGDHGVTKSDAAGGGLSGGPMKARVRMRGTDLGVRRKGTPERYVGDPDGIVGQLQETSYCGGAGVVGNVCGAPERRRAKDCAHCAISGHTCRM